ncbi:FAD-dependent monooxygenase [Nocardia goodfellowii]|uniref:2-polyprenyl-6-methoxyphenol hydroxylase-like FAD-dependent oxidoreductase n=1 Tax=Nocardia goodfellowii TaxID=882446 RepID=A0ABS4QPT5_9NOCA|nr:FAD-dependent monooxygenase [Nocardia goodfellowii]MBP2193732.1 2-polyprenyl-6-methoxyphenol hydroxylase-like FAD-dependent oxidoreductase [Nocardia goodfellowii]
MTTEVIVVGAGPTGLLLACELALCGVRPVVLERQPLPRELPKANGLGGEIVRLLDYRGLTPRCRAHSSYLGPVPGFPFGGTELDFTKLEESPLHAMLIPQPRLEQVLTERALELGAEIRRGHELRRFHQDADGVSAEARGPAGEYRLGARYLVGCDGGRSAVRAAAGIAFPGTTYPEMTRLGHVGMPDPVELLSNGDLEVPGLGRVRSGFTRTERGTLAVASFTPEVLLVSVTDAEPAPADPDAPVTLPELRAGIRRVLGADLPLGEPIWLSRFSAQARQAERYRAGRVFVAGDAAHLFPAGGAALNVGLLDTINLGWKLAAAVHGWAPPGLLNTYHSERHPAGARALLQTRAQTALAAATGDDESALRDLCLELLGDEQALRRVGRMLAGSDIRYPMTSADPGTHPIPGSQDPGTHSPPGSQDPGTPPLLGSLMPDLLLQGCESASSVAQLMPAARPVLLQLDGGRDWHEATHGWADRVDFHTAHCADRPADAVLLRPDGHVAWLDPVGGATAAAAALRTSLNHWFGAASATS